MQVPPPEHGDDLIEWSLRFIDTTMNFGAIPEVNNIDLPDNFTKLSKALRRLVSIPRDEDWALF